MFLSQLDQSTGFPWISLVGHSSRFRLDRKLDENDLFPKHRTEKFRAETLGQAHKPGAVSVLVLV